MVEPLQHVQDCLYFALRRFKYYVLRHSFFLVKIRQHEQFILLIEYLQSHNKAQLVYIHTRKNVTQ